MSLGRNNITLKRVTAIDTPTGSKDELTTLFSAFADISVNSAKQNQYLGIDLKNTVYTLTMRYSKSRSVQVGDKVNLNKEYEPKDLVVSAVNLKIDGITKYLVVTASKNSL